MNNYFFPPRSNSVLLLYLPLLFWPQPLLGAAIMEDRSSHVWTILWLMANAQVSVFPHFLFPAGFFSEAPVSLFLLEKSLNCCEALGLGSQLLHLLKWPLSESERVTLVLTLVRFLRLSQPYTFSTWEVVGSLGGRPVQVGERQVMIFELVKWNPGASLCCCSLSLKWSALQDNLFPGVILPHHRTWNEGGW